MAYSIAEALRAQPGSRVVHLVGSFHVRHAGSGDFVVVTDKAQERPADPIPAPTPAAARRSGGGRE